MRTRSDRVRDRLLDIMDAIAKARASVGNLSLEAFGGSWMNQFAAERALEILSEASRHIPAELKAGAPEIPWRDIADIGNVLRHVYDKTDPEVVWRVIEFDLDPLEAAIAAMLAELDAGS
jgi:uncharacterized protein with HEPN domain